MSLLQKRGVDDWDDDVAPKRLRLADAEKALDPHTTRVHNEYRRQLAHTTLPDWKAFEYLVSLETGTFGVDMAPPSFFDDEPVLSTRDVGLDHISFDKTIVGQTKHYPCGSSVDYKDFARFFCAASCALVPPSVKFLATLPETKLTDHVAKVASYKGCDHVTFDEAALRAKHVVEDAAPDPAPLPIVARASQLDAVSRFFAGGDTFSLQAPPGWGKTQVMLMIARQTLATSDGSIIVLVNTSDLLHQVHRAFNEQGVPASLAEEDGPDERVVVATYQSMPTRVLPTHTPSLVVCDEAHHLEAEGKWAEWVATFAKDARVLRTSGRFSSTTHVDHVVSYEDAIEEGVVSDYCVVLQHWTTGERTRAIAEYIRDTPELGALVFVFWNTVERARESHRASYELGLASELLIGEMADAERKRIRERVDGGHVRVLHLCGCYNEGVSISSVSAVVFGDPRSSVKNVFQCQARANRLHPNKPFYRVVLPIFGDADLEHVGEYVGILAKSDPRIAKAVRRLHNGDGSARVRVRAQGPESDAICVRTVEFLGSLLREHLSVAAKIDYLCSLSEKPNRNETAIVLLGDEEVEFAVGGFFNNIVFTWHPDPEKRPKTLDEATKARLERVPWIKQILDERLRRWAAEKAKPTMTQKVGCLCSLTQKPKETDKAMLWVGDEKVEFQVGKFLFSIVTAWHPDPPKRNQKLDEATKAKLERVPWFRAFLDECLDRWAAEKREPTTQQKVDYICSLPEKPKIRDTGTVYVGDKKVEFRTGKFVHNIANCWHPMETKRRTTFDKRPVQRRQLESLSWFRAYLNKCVDRWTAEKPVRFPKLKLDYLCSLPEKPKIRDTGTVYVGDKKVEFQVGKFLFPIVTAWHPDPKKRQFKTLEKATKAKLERVPWFRAFLDECLERWTADASLTPAA